MSECKHMTICHMTYGLIHLASLVVGDKGPIDSFSVFGENETVALAGEAIFFPNRS